MTNTIWNSADSTAHISLSDFSHTATSGSGSGNEGIRATVSRGPTGKWYLEYSNLSYPYGGYIGFALSTDTLGSTYQFGIGSSGYVNSGGNSYGPLSALTGTIVDFAVDLDNGKFWVRQNGGAWLGQIGGSADPATNTNGIPLPTYVSPYFPEAGLQFNPVTVTVDGGDWPSPTFAYPAPAGFSPWDGIAGVSGTWASTEAADTFAAIGYPGYPGIDADLAATEAPDTFAAVGYMSLLGAMSVTETGDAFSAYGYMPVEGTWISTEATDRFVGLGEGWGVNGTWASTEAPDVFAATISTPVEGTFIATEAADRFQALGEGVTRVRPRRDFFVT